ncbi:agamous-like MADS-box protein AGL29 [Henckelia pumila]|uniref:agamous-like MADS-box protein AGL29 n=1 Tax=Henckelia pumila TaxID=405737 RepID=UPI003C6E4472
MGRCRLRLELLDNPKARRRTYESRKKGLEKKASELSTLCGVEVCLITYPPPLKNEGTEPFVWSNNPDQAANMLESYKTSTLAGECSRSRTYDLAWFYKDRTTKLEEEIEKVRKTVREAKYPSWDERYDSLSSEELKMFVGVLTAKMESTKETINLLKQRKAEIPLMIDPRIDENSGFPTCFNAQSYLENQRRGMMMMMMNNGASFGGSVDPYGQYNVMNAAPQMMSYDHMQNVTYNSGDYFPQMWNMGF